MNFLIKLTTGFAFLTVLIFAVLMVLLVATNYALFLFGQRNNPSMFANTIRFVFVKNKKETISPYKIFKISMGLSVAIFLAFFLVQFTKGVF
jgi:hypothetical protein